MALEYSKTLEVKYETEVLVIGGGPAGVAAAVAAARQGVRVMLVETSGALGGSGTVGMVPEFMYFDDGINLLSGGIGGEIKHRFYGDKNEHKTYNVKVEELKRTYDDMVLESGVKLLFFTKVVDMVVENGKIEAAVVSSQSGVYAIKAKIFVDCTGDGNASVRAGVESDYGDEKENTNPATLCSFWGGVDFSKKPPLDGIKIYSAYQAGILSTFDLMLPGIKEVDRAAGVGGGNIGHYFSLDDRDEEKLTEAMVASRKTVFEYQDYYRTYVPGCEKAFLCYTANVMGIRESRRISCDYRMKYADYEARAVFDDEIGRYNYPIDIHPTSPDEEAVREANRISSLRYGDGESYGISLGCLIAKGVSNLFVGGRCIGSDRMMQSTMRVVPCCYITGQAAGVAASVCVLENTDSHNVNVKETQRRLVRLGAYLPNFKDEE